jgi:hypothetical protein
MPSARETAITRGSGTRVHISTALLLIPQARATAMYVAGLDRMS